MPAGPSHRLVVVRSKLVPPEIPDGLVVRRRLLDELSTPARFTLVAAMPGYGKTVTIRQWIDTVEAPVAWLSLDLLDAEPTSYWSHLLLAVESALPTVDEEPAMLLAERGVEDPLFLSALVAQLEASSRPLILVLDGLGGQVDRATLDGLALLVDRAGETLRLVVSTRINPLLPLARWRSVGWLNELREEELRLNDDEAIAIARRVDPSLDDDQLDGIRALNRRVEGWPLGLHMALLSRRAAGPGAPDPRASAAPVSERSDRMLVDYLVSGVLEAMTDEERSVALSLSVLRWFDPEMCQQLAGPQAGEVVRHLLARGVFLTVVDPRTGALRFHPLFREFMELELGWRDPAARIELHRRAAMLWRSRGDLTAAYHHLSAIGEASKAHEQLIAPALELVDQGDLAALGQFAQQLPVPADVDDARLALDLGIVAFHAEGTLAARRWCDRASTLIENAEGATPRDDRNRDDLLLRLHDRRCGLALLDADLDAALAGVQVHRQLVARAPARQVFEQRFPILAARVMLAMRRNDDADEWIQRAERLTGPEIVTAVTVPTLRAWHEWLFGRLDRAVKLVDGAVHWMDEHDIGAHHLACDTAITGARCHLSAGDLAEAARLAQRACSDADTLGCAWNHLQASYLAARVALVTGDPLVALQAVDDLGSRVAFGSCRAYADRIVGLEVEALAASGSLTEAVATIDRLQPGPRAELLRARRTAPRADELDALVAGRAAWPVHERLQAEVLLAVRAPHHSPSTALEAVVAECAATGQVLPLLGLGAPVERLLRSLPLDELHPALAKTLTFLAPASAAGSPTGNGVRLTSRELTLLELLPTHLSYAEMGERLYLSVNTVKSNLKSLYRKLDASTRGQAVDAGRRRGLL